MYDAFCLVLISPILAMAALVLARWPQKDLLCWDGPRRGPAVRLPSAEETAESIRRFREAVRRSELLDFVWERYSQGRGLLLEEMRSAAAKPKRRTRKAAIPDRL